MFKRESTVNNWITLLRTLVLSLEQIKEMPKFKFITYHRRDSPGTSKSKQYLPKVTAPPVGDDIGLDLGTWWSKAKVSVLASELVKIPEQREKLLKVLNSPPPKKVKFKEPLEEPQPALNNVQEYLNVILHTIQEKKIIPLSMYH